MLWLTSSRLQLPASSGLRINGSNGRKKIVHADTRKSRSTCCRVAGILEFAWSWPHHAALRRWNRIHQPLCHSAAEWSHGHGERNRSLAELFLERFGLNIQSLNFIFTKSLWACGASQFIIRASIILWPRKSWKWMITTKSCAFSRTMRPNRKQICCSRDRTRRGGAEPRQRSAVICPDMVNWHRNAVEAIEIFAKVSPERSRCRLWPAHPRSRRVELNLRSSNHSFQCQQFQWTFRLNDYSHGQVALCRTSLTQKPSGTPNDRPRSRYPRHCPLTGNFWHRTISHFLFYFLFWAAS